MKLSLPSVLCALAAGLAFAPVASRADYMPADLAVTRLEHIVTLSPDQEKQARQIFQNLKDVMDSMDPATRPMQGAQSRKDAFAAIRAILTPDQRAIYDRTPQYQGGGSTQGAPGMRELNQKIRAFVTSQARTSPDIAAQVGTVKKVAMVPNGSVTESIGDGPPLHPNRGSNLMSITGSNGTKTFKISWDMSPAGEMTVSRIEAAAN
jgi:hypothetical protein